MVVLGSISSHLWEKNIATAEAALAHPFVQSLGKEELQRSSFEAYIQQDIFFLSAFARCYAVAIQKAKDSSISTQQTLKELSAEIKEELQCVHERNQQHGQTTNNFEVHQATLNYTSFLDQATETQDLAGIMAAMAPCNSLYAFLGTRLKAAYPKSEHRYAEWIDFYSGSDFQKTADKMEHLLDELANQNDCERIEELYSKAMKLELAFFEAHWTDTLPED